MSTITTIQSSDLITNSRADLNNNFTALNSDKMETSVLDTDTTLAADSDAKIPSQKAVKAYVDAFIGVVTVDTVLESLTYSLTTTANQRVIVWFAGKTTTYSNNGDVYLKYNGVTKQHLQVPPGYTPVSLQYSEIPGAGTHNITVEGDIGTTDASLIIMKLG